MQGFDFQLDRDDALGPAVGLVVLQTDETMEHELRHWLPANVRLFHTRIPNELTISSDSLSNMRKALPAATSLLPESTHFKVIVYGCTSGATVIGEQAVAEAINNIFPAAKVSNPLSAIKAQLAALACKRIALLTPYVPDVSSAMISALEASGLQIINSGSFHEEQDNRVARIARQSILDAVVSLGKDDQVDAVVASCTNLRTIDLIQDAQAIINKPVVSSNSALNWHINELLTH